MSTEFTELLQIRNQKETKQRQVVQSLEREITLKKPMLKTLEESMALFKGQKETIENAFFDQISGEEMKPESLSEYQDKIKMITQFDEDLDKQYQEIIDDIQSKEEQLLQARQDLKRAENDVEKISMLVDDEKQTMARDKAIAEDMESEEQASEAWGRG